MCMQKDVRNREMHTFLTCDPCALCLAWSPRYGTILDLEMKLFIDTSMDTLIPGSSASRTVHSEFLILMRCVTCGMLSQQQERIKVGVCREKGEKESAECALWCGGQMNHGCAAVQREKILSGALGILDPVGR